MKLSDRNKTWGDHDNFIGLNGGLTGPREFLSPYRMIPGIVASL
jgi:hypothetical protein